MTEARQPGGPGDRLLKWRQVKDITGLSRTTAWRLQTTGDFPRPVRLSPGRVGWWETELDAWKSARSVSRAAPRAPRPAAERPPLRPRPTPPYPPPMVTPREPEPRVFAPPAAGRVKRRKRPAVSEDQIAFEF